MRGEAEEDHKNARPLSSAIRRPLRYISSQEPLERHVSGPEDRYGTAKPPNEYNRRPPYNNREYDRGTPARNDWTGHSSERSYHRGYSPGPYPDDDYYPMSRDHTRVRRSPDVPPTGRSRYNHHRSASGNSVGFRDHPQGSRESGVRHSGQYQSHHLW